MVVVGVVRWLLWGCLAVVVEVGGGCYEGGCCGCCPVVVVGVVW